MQPQMIVSLRTPVQLPFSSAELLTLTPQSRLVPTS